MIFLYIYLAIGVVIAAANLAQIMEVSISANLATALFALFVIATVAFWLPVVLYSYHRELISGR